MAKKTMDKIQLKLEPIKWVEVMNENNPNIKVNPYISLENKMILFKNYTSSYFFTNDFVDNYINAYYGLMLGVVDLCTNISVENLDMNDFISSGLWGEIKSKIVNYQEVQSDLYSLIKLYSEQRVAEQSMGVAFDRFSESILGFIQSIDLSSEGVQKIISQFQEVSQDFDEKYIKP